MQYEIQQIEKKVKIAIGDDLTQELSWKSYPRVIAYFREKFPGVDVSHVKIYLVDGYILNKLSWGHFAGCYIDYMRVILIKKNRNISTKRLSPFFEKIKKHHIRLSIEDVLVHEGIHAISAISCRSTRSYTFLEENYVYTNCVDFYRRDGKSDIEIINDSFLPFCINDILYGRKMKMVMKDVDKELNIKKGYKFFDGSFPKEEHQEEYNTFLNRHAHTVSKMLVRHARKMAMGMIDSYERFERKAAITSNKKVDKYKRFLGLKFNGFEAPLP